MVSIRRAFLLFISTFFLVNACVNEPAASTATTNGTDSTDTQTTDDEGFFDDYEGTNRVIWQKPEMVISLLGDLDNKTVADIGAGSGHFSKRLATKAKKVIAIDIDPRFVKVLDSIRLTEIPAEFRDRLEPRLATPDDPNLQPAEVDAVLIVNTYMYMSDRVAYLQNLAKSLTPGAKILIIDFKKLQTPIGPSPAARLSVETVQNELQAAGYKISRIDNVTLQYQYIVLAEK